MKVFLSYASEQVQPAHEIYGFLREHGIDVWFDKKSLLGGQDWEREIQIAQKSSNLFVLVCSKEIVSKAGVVQGEIKTIVELSKQQPFGHLFLICLRTERINMPDELLRWQYIDHFDNNLKLNLAKSIVLRYQQLNEEPPTELIDYIKTADGSGAISLFIQKSIQY